MKQRFMMRKIREFLASDDSCKVCVFDRSASVERPLPCPVPVRAAAQK
ncbi:hypothetical protein BP1258A_2748 [Burkholderia pseudomallei 1258a]|uniref:Uncharacterized protein n=3 Tax=Burkholderia pseudomallei TaxID=28450 RepID=A0A0H3HTS5_BURP2|nr:hypothetical protein BP1026B_I3694 [Burkholderia pseudomallei 1026b]AFR17907.1 hypothetical protein BPC006_I4085 [Burkholderia pseudomallei BPC006]EET08198.1 hypothetical protein BURPS1710A_0225 [Burkholderia pseudomallei 1710a]EIF56584.1 hypothetical protein BP1026A_4096 [Burkholderia pseudomallei 1026a]EIF61920.1 hypothetical protein BP1258A_2748 [Burkholderia pseudomallei 1258a]EIF63129.1 hypothetical protein BP1258B_3058 [Burkholderia pseudomallei 1258b]EIF74915.1 hypothetical protein 